VHLEDIEFAADVRARVVLVHQVATVLNSSAAAFAVQETSDVKRLFLAGFKFAVVAAFSNPNCRQNVPDHKVFFLLDFST